MFCIYIYCLEIQLITELLCDCKLEMKCNSWKAQSLHNHMRLANSCSFIEFNSTVLSIEVSWSWCSDFHHFLILINIAVFSFFFIHFFIFLHSLLACSHVAQHCLFIFHSCFYFFFLSLTLFLAWISTQLWIELKLSAMIVITHLIDFHVDSFCCFTWFIIFCNNYFVFFHVIFILSLFFFLFFYNWSFVQFFRNVATFQYMILNILMSKSLNMNELKRMKDWKRREHDTSFFQLLLFKLMMSSCLFIRCSHFFRD